jgi:transcriptional regulator with XRE-family HTH domain
MSDRLRAARVKFSGKVDTLGLEKVAHILRISVPHASRINNGRRRPGIETSLAIQEAFGIKALDWYA